MRAFAASGSPSLGLADRAVSAARRREASGLVERCRREGTEVRRAPHSRPTRAHPRPRHRPDLQPFSIHAPFAAQAWRVLHGVSEGVPGVTVDKYGTTLLVQSWREPIVRPPPRAPRHPCPPPARGLRDRRPRSFRDSAAAAVETAAARKVVAVINETGIV